MLLQGLLNKKPEHRLDWPQLLDQAFVKESEAERLEREQRICKSAIRAEASLAWKGEEGAIAGAPLYSGGHPTNAVTLPFVMTSSRSVIKQFQDQNHVLRITW
jgi:hypothetical protein